ncbi:glycosyltransferase family 4 protein [Vibrio breoganii]
MIKKASKKKLLFIVNVDWFFISHRLPIALAARDNGYEVHLACAVSDKKQELEESGIIVHPLELSRSGVGVFNEIRTLKDIFSVIRKVEPDVMHCVTIKPVLYGNIVARVLTVPTRISSISGLGYVFIANGARAKIFRFIVAMLYRLALKGSKKIIFQNSADRDILKSYGAVEECQELFIRGSGVDLSLYQVLPEPSGEVVVMLMARLLIDKGINEFVAAAHIVKSKFEGIRFVLVGDVDLDNPKSITKLQIQRWVDDGIVEYWGYSHNTVNSIAQSNIMVLPSYREGLPKSLIEAAACGRAVVTTDVPGCRDAIEENKTGLLVPLKSEGKLAEAILTLIEDKKLRERFAMNGRLLAESAFDINDVVSAHLDIYREQ